MSVNGYVRGTYDSSNQQYVIKISKDDTHYLANSTYLIMAQAFAFTSNGTATYSIVYRPENVIVTLIQDTPHPDQVAWHRSDRAAPLGKCPRVPW